MTASGEIGPVAKRCSSGGTWPIADLGRLVKVIFVPDEGEHFSQLILRQS